MNFSYFRPDSDDGNSGEVIDPYVEFRIRGHEVDYKKEIIHIKKNGDKDNKKETDHVKNNGFNPTWRETFQFDITFPELAILDLKVSIKFCF